VKDSSGSLSFTLEMIENTEGLAVLMGHDDLIAAGMIYGCDGAVAATANVTPTLVVDLVRAATRGDLARAMELQRALHKVRRLVERYPFPKVVKEGMSLINLPVGPCPQPVSPMPAALQHELREVLAELGTRGAVPSTTAGRATQA
jgi:4-hydroxy-tetrahydrodipicolinate synthase